MVYKWLNTGASILLFLISIVLQYRFANPKVLEFFGLISYFIAALAVLSFVLKVYFDYGHIDFIMGMLSQCAIVGIHKNKMAEFIISLLVILIIIVFGSKVKVLFTWIKKAILGLVACIFHRRGEH
ncbi:hypothetical protein ACOSQ3_028128 [Xanthoceras sorbifolium]